MKITVELNGTDKNPWHVFKLNQNPFPQIAAYKHSRDCLQIQKLGGDPIPNQDYIREMLRGFSPEFVDLCCKKFEPGKMVTFDVYWNE